MERSTLEIELILIIIFLCVWNGSIEKFSLKLSLYTLEFLKRLEWHVILIVGL